MNVDTGRALTGVAMEAAMRAERRITAEERKRIVCLVERVKGICGGMRCTLYTVCASVGPVGNV